MAKKIIRYAVLILLLAVSIAAAGQLTWVPHPANICYAPSECGYYIYAWPVDVYTAVDPAIDTVENRRRKLTEEQQQALRTAGWVEKRWLPDYDTARVDFRRPAFSDLDYDATYVMVIVAVERRADVELESDFSNRVVVTTPAQIKKGFGLKLRK